MLRSSDQEVIAWQRSTASHGTNCVEAALVDHLVWVRDSKSPDGPILSFTQASWRALLAAIQGLAL